MTDEAEFKTQYDDIVNGLNLWYANKRGTIAPEQRPHLMAMLELLGKAERGFTTGNTMDDVHMTIVDVVNGYERKKHLHSTVPAEISDAKAALLTQAETISLALGQGRAA